MKVPAYLTLGILALGLLSGLIYQQRLTAVRTHHREIATEAEKLGFPSAPKTEPRNTKRDRPGDTLAARTVAADVLGVALEMETAGDSSFESNPAMERRFLQLVKGCGGLGKAEWRQVIARLGESGALTPETRKRLLFYLVLALSDTDPESATVLAAESLEIFGNSSAGERAMLAAVGHWAELDPAAAANWLITMARTHQELQGDDLKRSVLEGAALNDPRQAFTMLDLLLLKDVPAGVRAIVEMASRSPEQRDDTLAALREHLARLTREADRVVIREEGYAALARSLEVSDFKKSADWLENANLSEQELTAFATGLEFSSAGEQSSHWIEWLSGHLQMDHLNEPVRELMGDWTRKDYLAAGKWLAAAPESNGKLAAVAAYAEAVTPYEPRTAVQWAMTLPDTWRRESVMRAIQENWPSADPEGAATFATEQGIK